MPHSLLQCCQTLWLVAHLDQIFKHVIKVFYLNVKEANLGKICTDFNASAERTTLINALAFGLRDVNVIFTQDNVVCTTLEDSLAHHPGPDGGEPSGKQPALCETGELASNES